MTLNIPYNNFKISILYTLILSLTSLSVFGQVFDAEQNPLSVKWRQINISGFKIIYPAELEKEAQRMANTIPKIYPQVGHSLNQQKTTIPIVFQNRGIMANGFVQLAPKKSQFYTTPPQQFDSQDWLNNLAVHELRHVAQFDKLTGGKAYPFPEEIYFAYLGVSVPIWFFEGDAVSTETSLTNAGRGRQPSWIMPFRTSLLNNQKLSYSKSYFGSSKDQTPGYYQLGYLLTSQLRKEFGKHSVDSLFGDIQKRPFRLYPFSRSLKKLTGKNTNQWYKYNLELLKNAWLKQDTENKSDEYEVLNQKAKFATNYFLPTAFGSNQILSLKHSKASPPTFVLIDSSKNEKKLFSIAYQEQPWFSYTNNILVWDEIRFDPRYKQRSYSVICSYNFLTQQKKQLTFKTRLFSPSLSTDGNKLIAVQIDLSNQANLVELDPQNGTIIKTHPNKEGDMLQTPALNNNGSKIAWVSVSESGKALWTREGDEKPDKIIDFTQQQLSRPVFNGDRVVFNAHLNGINNLFEVNPIDKKIVALSASKYGAFNGSLTKEGKSLLFNEYHLMGYDIVQAPIVRKEVQENSFIYFGEEAQRQEKTEDVFKEIPDQVLESKPYRPFANLFNFHSLSPKFEDLDKPGIQLKSTDLLSTLDFYAGMDYDSDLRKIAYNAGFTFKALYPIFSAIYRNRARTAFYKLKNATQVSQANWRENYINIKASLPLSINSFNHNYNFIGEIGTSYTDRNLNETDAKAINSTLTFPLNYRFAFTHTIRTAERDLAPKFAQVFSFKYFHQPFDNKVKGKLFALESNLYFPGILKNHTFSMGLNYQNTTGLFNASREITTVYGYAQIKAKSKLQNTLLLNYRFPIAFPDAEIGPLAYIRNIRGGLFSHYENIVKQTNLAQPKTFGFELRSSMNLLRYQPIVDLGARVIFVNQSYKQNPILELIFNYSF
ncbi:TolB family protein [Pedobacter insulae]|uniref:WD40-like Beta Propeller Repeat n=1 Tax=Pedobacter insulae TaxID=414048 RepID=A0A1I2UKH3_9SPHI|nr:hypothetical protein [Pedobacter insulae]SFG75336.1 hypothetical protein SAMN04489864_102110 [Pedobacter insulae]